MSQRQPKHSYWQEAPTPRDQLVLIPTALQEVIPHDHPVRLVDEILDELDWSSWEAAYDGSRGQPPIHPSVMAKVMLFAMIRRLRSSRVIEYELKHSIDFIWLASGRQIDHSTLSEFRRKNVSALKDIFRQMIRLAINLGIANLSELCIDGTRILASASKRKTWTAERLAKALDQLDAQLKEALESLELNDSLNEELLGQEFSADQLPPEVQALKDRREQLAMHMEVAKKMDENRRRLGTNGPCQIPKTDPDSRILPSKEGGYAANYTPMATTESTGGLIVHADVVIGNVEHDQLGVTVDIIQANFDVQIERILADSAYINGENLTIADAKEFELIGPLAEKQHAENPALREDLTQPVAAEDIGKLPIRPQTKRFDKTAFIYDEKDDVYYCPAGKPMEHRKTEQTRQSDGTTFRREIYTCQACLGCPLAALCRKDPEADGGRDITEDQYEPARRRHRERMNEPASQEAYSRRTHAGEYPFAVIKHRFDMRRFLLRGKEGVGQEWRWGSTGFNLLKLMNAWKTMRIDRRLNPAQW